MYSKGLMVRDNVFIRSVGHRSYGLALTAVDETRFEKNRIEGNSVGIHMQMCNHNEFNGNAVRGGYIGVRIATSSNDNRFTRNIFAANLHPVEIDGNVGDNAWSVDGVGNLWGNGSSEVDLIGEGVGSIPHREPDLLGRVRQPFPLVGLLSGSPLLDMVRFAQQHAVIPKIPAVIDPAPITSHGAHALAVTGGLQ
jgi:nitrous oxidase accessory protein